MVMVVKGTVVGLCLLCRKVKLMLGFIVIDIDDCKVISVCTGDAIHAINLGY